MKNSTLILLTMLSLTACTKIIDIDLNTAAPQVVIEGNINDQDKVFEVKITQTVNFSDPNTFPPVQGAVVTISDNSGNTENLTEVKAGIYQTKTTKGISGRTYMLKVIANGKTYTANCTMPAAVKLDGVKVTESTFQNGNADEKQYDILPQFLDPVNTTNYYAFKLYANGKKDKGYANVFSDSFFNGKYNTLWLLQYSQDLKLKSKDVLKIEMLGTDKDQYDFILSLTTLTDGSGATPANPVNNFTGGCLGYFGAYTLKTITVSVP